MTALLLLAAALPLPAQKHDEENPKGGAYADRMKDEIRARKQYEEAARATIPLRFLDALTKFQPGAQDLAATWAEFITADGTPFIALQLAPPPRVSLPSDDHLTFFAIVHDDAGKSLGTYYEPIITQQSKDDVFVERSLVMPLRKARGTFGLARKNEIIGMVRIDFAAENADPAAAAVSRVLLSSDVHLLGQAQQPLDPFAFGGTKVVPKPRASFHRADEVWLFLEMRNPALGTDGAPHVLTRVVVDGPTKLDGVVTPAEATPLKGVKGHYGIGNTVDVSQLKPGDYRLRVTVTDAVARQSYVREADLKISD